MSDLRALGQAIRAMQGATHRVDEAVRRGLGVNATDMRVLATLHRHGSLTPGHLAQSVEITAASMTIAVDRLSRRSLVSRGRDPHDARRSLITLAPSCAQWIEQAYGPLQTDGPAMLAQFTEPQLETIAKFVADSTQLQDRRAEAITQLPPMP